MIFSFMLVFCTNQNGVFQVQVWQEQVVFPEAEVLNSNVVKIIKFSLKLDCYIVVFLARINFHSFSSDKTN